MEEIAGEGGVGKPKHQLAVERGIYIDKPIKSSPAYRQFAGIMANNSFTGTI